MKNTIKITLMFVLLGSSVLADGNMGSGGREGCTVNCPPPCTESCGRPESEETLGVSKDGRTISTLQIARNLAKLYFGL